MNNLEPSPFVSVIIPVYNDTARLRLCLQALSSQSYPRSCYEVIVVDNASSEDIASVCTEFPQVTLAYEAKASSYAARNKGIMTSKGSILAFTDADCLPSSNWLEEGVRYLGQNPEHHVVGGQVELFAHNPARPTAVELYEIDNKAFRQEDIVKLHFSVTANLFTYRHTMDFVGPFNAELKSGGDADWGQRAHAMGVPMTYGAKVIVKHPARRTFGELYRRVARLRGGRYERTKKTAEHPQRTSVGNVQPRSTFWRSSISRASISRASISRVSIALAPLLQNKNLSLGQKAKVGSVMAFVRCVHVFEHFRLELGGKAKR